ncbi:glycosyltransferase [Rhodococcus sp. O3]|uniref:glycosyltransferase n=1 Tax=Rhodococcus sp. O3 TaxID=3404919 RepID=UPI003B67204A
MRPPMPEPVSGPTRRGAVVVPAYNEAAVIRRTLAPLGPLAAEGYFELLVVCNGCVDDTAAVARSIPGVRVVELPQGSKPAALNVGDQVASLWPRLYLDADIRISAVAVLAVLDRLARGDVLAGRPPFRYDFEDAESLVCSYYRARQRIPQKTVLWGAGVYGLTEAGHTKFGSFPDLTGDDLFVDNWFGPDEKVIVDTEPVTVTTPTDIASLLAILRRNHRGVSEACTGDGNAGRSAPATALAVLRSIRGPQSAADALVYSAFALAARWGVRQSAVGWERDESSRSLH